jgi:hypothetical protein
MILYTDVEASGLLVRELPLDHEGQPWAVTVSAELCDINDNVLAHFSTPIRAEGRKITSGATRVHGISSSVAGRSGVPEISALGMLCHLASEARYVVGWGIEFDRKVIESVLMRRKKDTRLWTRPNLEFVDTMKAAAHVCKIPSEHESGGYKWPTLDEGCEIMLGEPRREGTHNSWDDLQRAKRCTRHLRNLNILEIAA